MKLTLIFKTPDIVDDTLARLPLTTPEKEKIELECRQWIKWGEIVSIQIDTVEHTATVMKV